MASSLRNKRQPLPPPQNNASLVGTGRTTTQPFRSTYTGDLLDFSQQKKLEYLATLAEGNVHPGHVQNAHGTCDPL